MGIIDSLSAGYRLVGRRVELLLIPLLLDLLLWLSPRLSIAGLMERLSDFYARAVTLAQLPEGSEELTQMTRESLHLLGESVNLLAGLVSSSLLHVPLLTASVALPASERVVQIGSGWGALGLWLLFGLVGLWLGVFYLELLARVVPLGATAKPADLGALLRNTGRHFWRITAFILVAGIVFFVVLIPFSMVVGLALMIAAGIGTLLFAMLGGILFVALIYLHFVAAAIVLDDLSVMRAIEGSIRIVRSNFFSVLGFVFLVFVIGAGIGALLAGVAEWQPAGTLAAILLNAYVGTGLAMALLVFYRSRVLRAAQPATAQDMTLG